MATSSSPNQRRKRTSNNKRERSIIKEYKSLCTPYEIRELNRSEKSGNKKDKEKQEVAFYFILFSATSATPPTHLTPFEVVNENEGLQELDGHPLFFPPGALRRTKKGIAKRHKVTGNRIFVQQAFHPFHISLLISSTPLTLRVSRSAWTWAAVRRLARWTFSWSCRAVSW